MSVKSRAILLGCFLMVIGLGVIAYAVVTNVSGHLVKTGERKVGFYQDSMHPWIKSDHPGKCTICAMDLTPIYDGQVGFGAGGNLVVMTSNQITVLNVQTEEVKHRALHRSLRVAGTLEVNETSKTVISAPARGRIDALTVDYAGVEVARGQKLITMFSPELVQLRKTLLAVRQNPQKGASNSVAPASADAGIYTGDILAPQSGVVLERNVYTGQYVAEGDRLLTIVDASTLWFRFDVYQDQLPWFEIGQPIEVEVSGLPGQVFVGVISFVDPNFNETTRTVKVRADIRNPLVESKGHQRRQLKYGMYAEGHVRSESPATLVIPRTAVLSPGDASYAYVEKGSGAYERRRLKLGRQGDEYWEVLKGLAEGESVVTSGNMLLDAQAQFSLGDGSSPAATEETASLETSGPPGLEAEAMRHPAEVANDPIANQVNEISDVAGGESLMAIVEEPTLIAPRAVIRQAAAGRSERMSAMMSPGAELQMIRRAAILEERAKAGASVPQPAAATAQPLLIATATPPRPREVEATPAAAPGTEAEPIITTEPADQVVAPPSNLMRTHREVDAIRRTTSAEMREMRMAALAAASPQKASAVTLLSSVQRELLQGFLAEAGDVSQALAADDLAGFNAEWTKLSGLLPPLTDACAIAPTLNPLLQRLAAAPWEAGRDLATARTQFLPVSTTVVELAKQLRKQTAAGASLKIYHCPMAPAPGVWLQAKGPLRNPYFGAKMLGCGEEVMP